MADFRSDVYANYVSSFKGGAATRDERAMRYYLRWCEIKYGPFLKALPAGGRVLDLGCGSGDVMRLLTRHGFDAEGIDISDEQIRLAVDAGLRAHTADAFEYLASRRETYDGIVALDFIEHFAKEELLRLLAAIRTALKPGGWLLLQTPNGQGLFANTVVYGDLSHLTILSPHRCARRWRWPDSRTSTSTRPAPPRSASEALSEARFGRSFAGQGGWCARSRPRGSRRS